VGRDRGSSGEEVRFLVDSSAKYTELVKEFGGA